MKKPNAANVGELEQGSSNSSVARPLSVALKFKTLRDFLEHEALTNPLAAVLLLEFGRQLAGAAS